MPLWSRREVWLPWGGLTAVGLSVMFPHCLGLRGSRTNRRAVPAMCTCVVNASPSFMVPECPVWTWHRAGDFTYTSPSLSLQQSMRGILTYPHFIDGEVQTLQRERHLLKALSLGTEGLRFRPKAVHFQKPYPSCCHMASATAI